MPNEESPVDSMEFECDEDQPQVTDQKNGEKATPVATPSPEVWVEIFFFFNLIQINIVLHYFSKNSTFHM